MNFKQPFYDESTNYKTNAKSIMDYLAKSNKFLEIIAKRVEEYDKELAKRFKAWDKNLEEFDDEVMFLLIEWLEDGTLADIINNEVLDMKSQVIVSKEEPRNIGQNTYWYHDVGESGLDMGTGSGINIINAIVSEDEIEDKKALWFDV